MDPSTPLYETAKGPFQRTLGLAPGGLGTHAQRVLSKLGLVLLRSVPVWGGFYAVSGLCFRGHTQKIDSDCRREVEGLTGRGVTAKKVMRGFQSPLSLRAFVDF